MQRTLANTWKIWSAGFIDAPASASGAMRSRKSAMAVACDRKGRQAGVAGFLILAFLVAIPIILEILKLNLLD